MASTNRIDERTERFRAELFAGASAEFLLVAACCRWPVKADELLAMAGRDGLRWEQVLALATRHRVVGFVAAALRDVADVPEVVQQKLKQRGAKIQQQNLAHVAVALRIAKAFRESGIAFTVLKGAPLSQLAFGTLGVRQMRDMDLLVAPEELERAVDVLKVLGLKAQAESFAIKPEQEKLVRRFRKHHEFLHEMTGVQVELHWRACDNVLLHEAPKDAVQWVAVGSEQTLPTLTSDELFLSLCVHGAGHAWFRLKWLADVAAILRVMDVAQWERVWALAREKDLDRTVEQAVMLCAALYGEDSVPVLPESSRLGRWLARVAAKALLTDEAKSQSEDAAFVPPGQTVSRYLLRRSWRYRLEEARIAVTAPVDWRTMPLPERLQFAYPLLRGPLWVKRRLAARSR